MFNGQPGIVLTLQKPNTETFKCDLKESEYVLNLILLGYIYIYIHSPLYHGYTPNYPRVLHPRWAFNLGCSTRFSSQTPSLKTWRAKVWAKEKWNDEKPTPPLFLKMKNQGAKDWTQCPWAMLKIQNKNGTRDENSCAERCSKKNTLNYKIKISPENGQPHPFHPTQLLCLPKLFTWCLVGM